MIGTGDKAPALNTILSDGSALDLGAPGQKLALYFYPKDRNGSERLTLRSCADVCLSAPSH